MTETQLTEQEFFLLRKHGSALVFPVLLLGVIAGATVFLQPRIGQKLELQILISLAALLAFLFWLLPSIRFFSNRYRITSNRVVIHRGLFGRKVEQAAWGELSGVSLSRGFGLWLRAAGDVHIHRVTGQDLVLKAVPGAKNVVLDIERILASRQDMRK